MLLNPVHLARIDLNLLVLFAAVFEERHVARAARRLNLTPSAVSHGLTRLRRLLHDPLFLKTAKGVVPTDRAVALAEPIEDVLARAGAVVEAARPFDPAATRRRFTIGAPDAISAVFLPPLLDALSRSAPGIDIGLRQLMPQQTGGPAGQWWHLTLDELEARSVDLAVLPIAKVPPRFVERALFEEDFVIAMRRGHAFARDPSLERFCRMRHLLVSLTGDANGLVDRMLAAKSLTRRVVLTVPSFMMALAQIADSDLIATLPRHVVTRYARRFDLLTREFPLPWPRDVIRVVATRAAMRDAGIAWLHGVLADCMSRPPRGRARQ